MITGVLGVLGALTTWFAVVFTKDFWVNRHTIESKSTWTSSAAIGLVTDFFDTLGIGSFATSTALMKLFNQTEDRTLPGTLNVAHTIPTILEAFIFMKVIEVEPVTLISMLFSASIGAYVGAGIISKLNEKKIQLYVAIALFVSASLMLAGQLNLMPSGGEAIGLSGIRLIIAVIGNFILGVLMTAGIGLYAPCMALIFALGMSPRVAFPIMMGSCAFLMPAAAVKFVKEGAYDRRIAMGGTLAGIVGVLIAAYLVKTLPLNVLKWLVEGVIFYTSLTLFKSSRT